MAYTSQTATAICIDVGSVQIKREPKSQVKQHADAGMHTESLTAFKDCLSLMLQEQLFNEVKDEFALVIFGKNVNSGGSDGKVDNKHSSKGNTLLSHEVSTCTKVVRGFERISWLLLESAGNDVNDSGQGKSSFLSGVQRCIDLINADKTRAKTDKRRKISKYNIVCFTSVQQAAGADFDSSRKHVLDQLLEMRIDTKFVLPDEACTDIKQLEKTLTAIREIMKPLFDARINELDSYLTLFEAEDILKAFTPKMMRQLPWKADLELGETFQLPVDVFAITKEATIKQKFTNYIPGQSAAAGRPAATTGDVDMEEKGKSGFEVHAVTQYYDQTQKRNIELDETDDSELTRGIKVGRSHIPLAVNDRYADLEYAGQRKCFQLLHFAPRSCITPLFLFESKFGTRMVMPRKDDDNAACHLLALTTALQKADSVAIVSYGYNARSTPAIACLVPEAYVHAPQKLGLMMHLLPYRQDAREAFVNSLRQNAASRLNTVVENPKDDIAMGEFVKMLSLENIQPPAHFNIGLASQLSSDNTDDALEERLARLVHHANPQMQKLLKMIGYRALHNNTKTLPKWSNEEVSTIFALPADLQDASANAARILNDAVQASLPDAERNLLKPAVVAAAAASDDASDDAVGATAAPPPSGGDKKPDAATSSTGSGKPKAAWSDIYVSEPNDFKALLEEFELSEAQTRKALDYIESLIEELAANTENVNGSRSTAPSMAKLIAAMALYRRKAVKHEFVKQFNAFLLRFKVQVELYKLDAVLQEMKKMNIGLISHQECSKSTVSDNQAKVF